MGDGDWHGEGLNKGIYRLRILIGIVSVTHSKLAIMQNWTLDGKKTGATMSGTVLVTIL